ncbi:MAG: ABC transporter ATP-binding protein [Lacunisphaera sp.]|nr:ABC transporter ATP-binding protein [Lacunisphaera sp.]
MSQPVVICRGVKKQFGNGGGAVQALRGIDVEINQGELFMLVGPSGCGKTTLISVIAGIINQTEGECRVLGESVSGMSSGDKAKFRARNLGFVFQAFNLLPALTAAENVALPLFILGESKKAAVTKAYDLLAQVGLKDRGKSLPAELSGGQQQRVAIARALIHEPKIIVCDEPTSAIDHVTGANVLEMMRTLSKDHGTTLIIVTHDNRIFPYADRMGEMDDGHIMAIHTPETTQGRHYA